MTCPILVFFLFLSLLPLRVFGNFCLILLLFHLCWRQEGEFQKRPKDRQGGKGARWADCKKSAMKRVLLLSLEVVEEDGALLRILTPVLDDDARAVDNLAGVALAVNLA
jgi:hypothetical protein